MLNTIDVVVSYLSSFGMIGGLLLILLESIIPALPLGVFVGLNMLAYGNILGLIISYIGCVCGCMASFCIFRYLLKNRIMKIFKPKMLEKINKWMGKLSNIKFSTLVFIIALPPTPSFVVNIAAGLSDISFKKYFFSVLVGKPSMLIFFGYVAVSLVDSFKDPMKLVWVVILVLIAYSASKIVGRIVNLEE